MAVQVSGDSTLSAIISRIVQAVGPDRVILFGSRAAGTAHPQSDYDLLIIKPSQEPHHRRLALARKALWGVRAPVDLLWYTPDEVDEWSGFRTHVTSQVVRTGRVVYEKGQG
jgi:predicted nucleotidyltransferase